LQHGSLCVTEFPIRPDIFEQIFCVLEDDKAFFLFLAIQIVHDSKQKISFLLQICIEWNILYVC
jgi:hypothetical protein